MIIEAYYIIDRRAMFKVSIYTQRYRQETILSVFALGVATWESR